MRITIMTGPFLSIPPAACGAVERIWWDMARIFSARGHEVRFICRGHGQSPEPETFDGVRIESVSGPVATRFFAVNLVNESVYSWRAICRANETDILVLNSFSMPVIAPCFRYRFRRICYNMQRMPKGQLPLYGGVDRFYAVSNAVSRAISHGRPKFATRTLVVPNPISTDVFRPAETRRSSRWENPLILYAGRIHPEKGLDLLIDAFRHLHRRHGNSSLMLVGPHAIQDGGGGDSYMESLRTLAEGLPIEFSPPIYHRATLANAFRDSTVFCYPSIAEKGESFGVAPLEAMATGVPTIVSGLECFSDFLRDRVNGRVFNHNADSPASELARKLDEMLTNRAETERIGNAGMESAQRFSNEKIAERYLVDFELMLDIKRQV